MKCDEEAYDAMIQDHESAATARKDKLYSALVSEAESNDIRMRLSSREYFDLQSQSPV